MNNNDYRNPAQPLVDEFKEVETEDATMTAIDSVVDSSNDGDTASIITPPPPIMPPTLTSSINTLEGDFGLQTFPPLPLNSRSSGSLIHPSTLPSTSHCCKMRSRTLHKNRLRLGYNKLFNESTSRKLRYAASMNNIELLKRVLESDADPNAADEYKRSPLHLAACRGYIQIVQQLLKYGANPNVVDSLGNTPLHLAIISATSNNFNLVVRVLLEGGASVHTIDGSGKSPLELAEARLRLMRSIYLNPNQETSKLLNELCMLIALIRQYMQKQQLELEEIWNLEKRFQRLRTRDDLEQVASKTTDDQ